MSKYIGDVPLARRRVLAAELLLNGESISEVSRNARLSLPNVSKYKALIEKGGPEALARLRIHGNVPRLDDASQSWLVSAIKHSPDLHGYPASTWAIRQLRELIFRHFGIQFSASHVGHLVRGYASRTASLIQFQKIHRVRPLRNRKATSMPYAGRLLQRCFWMETVSSASQKRSTSASGRLRNTDHW